MGGKAALIGASTVALPGLWTSLAVGLAQVVEGAALPATDRVQAGVWLGDLGDLRIPVTRDEWRVAGSPQMHPVPPLTRYWCPISAGSFVIGFMPAEIKQLPKDEQGYFSDVENEVAVLIAAFELARYPVTNAQYALFIDAGGYDPEAAWWQDDPAGRQWLRHDRRRAPSRWDDARFWIARPSSPVVGISWLEAMAYCRWLTRRLNDGYEYMSTGSRARATTSATGRLHQRLRPLQPPLRDAPGLGAPAGSRVLRQTYGEVQEPELTVLKGVGPFAVSLYRGATTLGGFSAPDRPEFDAGLREVDPKRSERLLSQILQIQAGRDANTAGRDVTTAGRDNLTGAQIAGGYTGGDRTERHSVFDAGSGNQFGDLTFGDIAGRDIIKTGDITGSSGVAIGRGAQSSGRKIDTGGGDYAAGSIDKRRGNFVSGDQFNLSGDFSGSILNLKSTLTNVSQMIGTAPHGDATAKAQLQALIAQLSAELEKVPADKASDAEAVAETAKQAVEQATKAKPNKTLVTIDAEGLKAAAQNLAAVLPTVLPLATKIAEAIQKFVPK